jgi:uncharacterized protein YqeY
MSTLKESIANDLKEAMKNKQAETVSTLRLLLSAIKTKEIALREGEEVILNDEQVAEAIRSEIKKRNDSISAYEQGGRQDLAQKEKNEIKILEKYLPPSLSGEEIEKIVREEIGAMEEKDFGRVMGKVMARLKGKAEGGKISELVKKVLGR